jgi:hypothetical protein
MKPEFDWEREKVALTALMYKMMVIANAKLKKVVAT